MNSKLKTQNSQLVIVALGSNLGDSRRTVSEAMARLQMFSDEPIFKSSLWQTSPVDCPADSTTFVNAVVGLAPQKNETPESLLGKLQSLEKEFGRQPGTIRNEPRPLDLDLIAFGSETRHTAELIVPHSRVHHRRFVLQPLCEIAPDLVLPGQHKTVSELLAGLQGKEIVERLDG